MTTAKAVVKNKAAGVKAKPATKPTTKPTAKPAPKLAAKVWVQLSFLTIKMYDYLPEVDLEVEVVEYSIRLTSSRQGPALTPVAAPLLADLEQPSENGVRAQLLEIRQRVDNLLASLD